MQMDMTIRKSISSSHNFQYYGISPLGFMFPSLIFGNLWQSVHWNMDEIFKRNSYALNFAEKNFLNTESRPCITGEIPMNLYE